MDLSGGHRGPLAGRGHFTAAADGAVAPATILSAGVHGNETAPIELLLQLTHDLSQGRQPLTQALLIVFGNLPAIRAARRYLHNDLNRLFGGRHLAVTPGNESRRAFALEQAVQAFIAPPIRRGRSTVVISICTPPFADRCIASLRCSRPTPGFFARFLSAAAGQRDGRRRAPYRSGRHLHPFHLRKVRRAKRHPGAGESDAVRRQRSQPVRRRRRGDPGWIADAPLPPRDKAPVDYFLVEESIIKREGEFTLNLAADVENFTALPAGYEIARQAEKRWVVQARAPYILFPNAGVATGQRAGLLLRAAALRLPQPA